jgi:hypothetical protein
MNKPATTNPAEIVTRAIQFSSCTREGDMLFSVNAGIPVKRALEKVSCLLSAISDVVNELGMESGTDCRIWAAFYLVEMSQAVIEAAEF